MHELKMQSLLVGKQRSAFTVLLDDLSTLEGITAKETRDPDGEGQNEKEATDGEGEDPLELEKGDFGEELTDTRG
jgi:hypothetical protein